MVCSRTIFKYLLNTIDHSSRRRRRRRRTVQYLQQIKPRPPIIQQRKLKKKKKKRKPNKPPTQHTHRGCLYIKRLTQCTAIVILCVFDLLSRPKIGRDGTGASAACFAIFRSVGLWWWILFIEQYYYLQFLWSHNDGVGYLNSVAYFVVCRFDGLLFGYIVTGP